MKTRTNEKVRIAKYFEEKKAFNPQETKSNNIEFVEKITLKGVKVLFEEETFRNLRCYLYHFDKLGISAENIRKEFEGKDMLIYRLTGNKLSRARKCPWCYAPVEKMESHILEAHGKTMRNIMYMKFQQNLYKELLTVVRETDHHFATMFMNVGCQLCVDPVMKGRELCCSIPTSFRDRMRSLRIMGITAKTLPKEYVTNPRIGQILLVGG